MRSNILEYKRYIAQLDFDLDDNIIVGRVINTNEIITFHAKTLSEAKQAFEDVIDTYLDACITEGISASRPYSGKFNLRIDPDLHKQLTVEAAQVGLSLNKFTEELINIGLSHRR